MHHGLSRTWTWSRHISLSLFLSLSFAHCLLHTPTCTKRVTQKDQPGSTFQLYIWFYLNLQQNWLTALPDSPKWKYMLFFKFLEMPLHLSWPQLYVTLLTPCPRLNFYQLPSCDANTTRIASRCLNLTHAHPTPHVSPACPSFIS